MSNVRRKYALLHGFTPIFPSGLRGIVGLRKSGFTFNWRQYIAAASGIPGYSHTGRPVTSDGYQWFCALYFVLANGSKMAILIPWAQDWSFRDGVTNDRSPAVYMLRGKWGGQGVSILNDLAKALATQPNTR